MDQRYGAREVSELGERKTETERGRDTERQRERDRERDRPTERQTNRESLNSKPLILKDINIRSFGTT